jgi:hypothetical protein
MNSVSFSQHPLTRQLTAVLVTPVISVTIFCALFFTYKVGTTPALYDTYFAEKISPMDAVVTANRTATAYEAAFVEQTNLDANTCDHTLRRLVELEQQIVSLAADIERRDRRTKFTPFQEAACSASSYVASLANYVDCRTYAPDLNERMAKTEFDIELARQDLVTCHHNVTYLSTLPQRARCLRAYVRARCDTLLVVWQTALENRGVSAADVVDMCGQSYNRMRDFWEHSTAVLAAHRVTATVWNVDACLQKLRATPGNVGADHRASENRTAIAVHAGSFV